MHTLLMQIRAQIGNIKEYVNKGHHHRAIVGELEKVEQRFAEYAELQAAADLRKLEAGSVTVPREPTEAMIDAANAAACKEDLRWNDLNANDVWQAMIAAAPPASDAQTDDERVTDAMVESVGKALYIYWDDVNNNARKAYSTKVRKALEAALRD